MPYKTCAYVVTYMYTNETQKRVFASYVKAALFIARFERSLAAWSVEYQEVDGVHPTIPYTLKVRAAVEVIQRKCGLRGADSWDPDYDVRGDPLLYTARRATRKL